MADIIKEHVQVIKRIITECENGLPTYSNDQYFTAAIAIYGKLSRTEVDSVAGQLQPLSTSVQRAPQTLGASFKNTTQCTERRDSGFEEHKPINQAKGWNVDFSKPARVPVWKAGQRNWDSGSVGSVGGYESYGDDYYGGEESCCLNCGGEGSCDRMNGCVNDDFDD